MSTKIRPITSDKGLIGGQHYIKMYYNNGSIKWNIFKICGKKYLHPSSRYWFIKIKGGIFVPQSLRDMNVIPNRYNDNSLWPYNTKVFKHLKYIADENPKNYLDILTRYKLGKTYHLSKNK